MANGTYQRENRRSCKFVVDIIVVGHTKICRVAASSVQNKVIAQTRDLRLQGTVKVCRLSPAYRYFSFVYPNRDHISFGMN